MSHDIEDIVAILDGRQEIVEEIRISTQPIQDYLATEFSSLLKNRGFIQALQGHLASDYFSDHRANIVMARIESLCMGK